MRYITVYNTIQSGQTTSKYKEGNCPKRARASQAENNGVGIISAEGERVREP